MCVSLRAPPLLLQEGVGRRGGPLPARPAWRRWPGAPAREGPPFPGPGAGGGRSSRFVHGPGAGRNSWKGRGSYGKPRAPPRPAWEPRAWGGGCAAAHGGPGPGPDPSSPAAAPRADVAGVAMTVTGARAPPHRPLRLAAPRWEWEGCRVPRPGAHWACGGHHVARGAAAAVTPCPAASEGAGRAAAACHWPSRGGGGL